MKFIGLITNNQYVEIECKDKDILIIDKESIAFLLLEGYRKNNDMSSSFNDEFGKELDDSLISLKDVLHPGVNNK